jgi:glycogen debranching enzyme
MLLAGDELGRTQRGNNNAYCQDAAVNWVAWNLQEWQEELQDVVRRLIRIRREHPALRPAQYPSDTTGNRMHWFTADGLEMSEAAWTTPENRTLQYLATSGSDTTVLVVHGDETTMRAALPEHPGITDYELLWTSADDTAFGLHSAPGEHIQIDGPTLLLYSGT